MRSDTEVLEEVEVDEDQLPTNHLIVYNDDKNTFEWVIVTLMKVCKHTLEQAEQCTHIIHHKGKCSVKEGSFEELEPLKYGINDAGINADIF